MRGLARFVLLAGLVMAGDRPCWAQATGTPVPPPSASTPPPSTGPTWEITAYGGYGGRMHAGGSVTLPAAGAPLVTSNPTFPSRAVPSWFFGDGATLLNNASGDLGLANPIRPLDPMLTAAALTDRGAVGGVRLGRRLSGRLWLEVGVDVLAGGPALSSGFTRTIEASRASFVSAFTGLLAAGPFSSTTVGATSATTNGAGRQVVTSGTVRWSSGPRLHVVPYVTVGGGVLARTGTLPTATLVGSYQTVAAGAFPIHETDTVTVRFAQNAAAVGILGGGLRRAFSDRWGLDIDGRLLIGPQKVDVLLDATPLVAHGAPAGFIESFSYPSIQFSDDPATGRQSSLSAPALQGLTVFSGGLGVHGLFTVGIYARF